MAQIEIERVSKAFKNDRVLDDVSLSAETGRIVVIFGPSGTGKTVLLRLVAGVEDLDAGIIRLQGRDVTRAAPEARGIGMAFQNFALFPHMSAYDNIASALTAGPSSKAQIKVKVESVAKLLKIGHVLQHAPRELSNGQKQRAALARALVSDPRILLLDDPLRNVDAKLRYEMRMELPSLLRTSGSTVLYVTQDYREAMALGDKIAVLLDGKFAQIATPAKVYREPASLGVARLFGDPTVNLIAATPLLSGDGPVFDIGGVSIAMSSAYAHAAGRPCVIGVRPESIAVGDKAKPGGFPVEVVAVTPLNEKSVLLLRGMEGREWLAAESGEGGQPRRHGAARASFDRDAILVFDAASGLRVAPQTH
jgi:multiple sugar transport system ATP-binding protein